jgi:hypothetical protein
VAWQESIMSEFHYTAKIHPSFWVQLMNDYENEPRSRRYKQYNEHWHYDFLKYVVEKLGVDSVSSEGVVTICTEQSAVMFYLKYSDYILNQNLQIHKPSKKDIIE